MAVSMQNEPDIARSDTPLSCIGSRLPEHSFGIRRIVRSIEYTLIIPYFQGAYKHKNRQIHMYLPVLRLCFRSLSA